MNKNTLAKYLVNFTDGWSSAVHHAIELKLKEKARGQYPDGYPLDKLDEQMKKHREFYYQRFTTTGNLLLAGSAIIISIIALFVSLFV
ncbi:hypothetical protein [Thalassomonas haliotis]|uniref:Uncharacterized protein n=1 Tax=Thalassomonas haliotis TaxID=485448 RepID=A0ABY7VH73_9GAMM|nr:hypothetical protein [Thalassomonas haliotis]WDE12840.1 hypothetical protein H3N35_05060 [Thalassomonas haliotis]